MFLKQNHKEDQVYLVQGGNKNGFIVFHNKCQGFTQHRKFWDFRMSQLKYLSGICFFKWQLLIYLSYLHFKQLQKMMMESICGGDISVEREDDNMLNIYNNEQKRNIYLLNIKKKRGDFILIYYINTFIQQYKMRQSGNIFLGEELKNQVNKIQRKQNKLRHKNKLCNVQNIIMGKDQNNTNIYIQ